MEKRKRQSVRVRRGALWMHGFYQISQIACVFCCGDAVGRNMCRIRVLATMGQHCPEMLRQVIKKSELLIFVLILKG